MEKKISWNLAGLVFLFGAIFAGYFVYSNLNKGLIFNDEAYYLLHFRDFQKVITVDASNFFRIFQPFYTDNIFHFRVITYLLLNSTTFLLFFLAAKYFVLKIHPILIGSLGILFNFISWGATNIVLHQYIGNKVLTNLSLCFLLLYLLNRKSFLLIFSGFFLGILMFDGIPHVTIFLPVGLFLLLNFWKIERKNILYFGIGVLIAVLVYFTFIQKFSDFVSQLEYLKIYQQFHTKQHPKSFFFYWFAKVLGLIFFPGILAIFLIHRFARNRIKSINNLIWIVAFITILSLFFYPFVYLNYLLLLLLLYRYWLSENSFAYKTFLTLLFLTQFCLAFGSGAYFEGRSGQYFIYFILTIVVILSSLYDFRYFLAFVIYCVFQVALLPDFVHTKGWKDFVFTEQTEPVKINGHDLLLDKKRKNDIEDLRPFLQNQPKVIYSNNHLVGYLYILDAYPPIPYYFTLKKYVKFILDKKGDQPDDYIYLESNDYPFSPKEIIPLQFVNHPENFRVVKSGRFTLYLPKNFQEK